jgi:hypothetical protein
MQTGFEYCKRLIEPDLLTSIRADLMQILGQPGYPDRENSAGRSARQLAGNTLRWAKYRLAQSLESLHALSQHPGLVEVAEHILECEPYCHPRRIIDVLPPRHWIPPHQDHFAIQGTVDVIVAWIPLEPRAGTGPNLRVSAWDGKGLRPLRWVGGVGAENDLSPQAHAWQLREFELGDIAIYHCLVSHYVGVNIDSAERIALEFRYQRSHEEICLASLRPHNFPRVPDWSSLSREWSTRRWVARPPRARIVPFHMPLKIEDWHKELKLQKSSLLWMR